MRYISSVLAFVLILPLLMAGTKQGAVRVSVGEPSVWSLEQAHYLLERLRNKNGRLEPAPFTNLDPNAVGGSRFEAIRRLLGVQVEYDQSVGATNKILSSQYESNLTMRKDLETRWVALVDEQAKVDAQLRVARIEYARMNPQTTTEQERGMKAAEIAALEKSSAELGTRITAIQQTMGSLGVSPGFSKSGVGGPAVTLPDFMDAATIKAALKGAADREPKLAASAALDNHIQFNYEMIAKQLTLLRDETGPGKRILFLELPQTVYGVPGRGDGHLGQSWWRVAGIVRGRITMNVEDLGNVRLPGSLDMNVWAQLKANKSFTPDCPKPGKDEPRCKGDVEAEGPRSYGPLRLEEYEPLIKVNPPVRALELIPRVNALNVAEIHSAVRTSAFSIVGRLLWGLGAQLNYQKQRETFEQFIQQEVYASGHGKGSSQFGWTFGPNPGTKSVSPGVRTTYAVLVVPDDAAFVVLKGRGCQFNRKSTPPATYPDDTFQTGNVHDGIECGSETEFRIQVPPADVGFSVSEIDYLPVKAGNRATVFVRGADISPQISVLVDGVPLTKVLSLGSPNAWRDEHAENNTAIRGQLEYLNSGEFVISFSMPPEYTGTPNISLVSPSKAYTLNRLRFRKISGCTIESTAPNDCLNVAGWDEAKKVISFGQFARNPQWRMFKPSLSITKVDIAGFDRAAGKIALVALGRNFDTKTVWLLNGKNVCEATDQTATSTRLECPRPETYAWQVSALGHDPHNPEQDSVRLEDPFPPVVEKADVIKALKAVKDEEDEAKSRPAMAIVKLTGKHFNSVQEITVNKGATGKMKIGKIELNAPKEVAITITDAESPITFHIRGSAKGYLETREVTIDKWE